MNIGLVMIRLHLLGLPFAHVEFKESNKNPAPDPPFVIYLKTVNGRGADSHNNIFDYSMSIELYTDAKSSEFERRIETEVLPDIAYRKYQAQIHTENMVQTAYEFTFTQKGSVKMDKQRIILGSGDVYTTVFNGEIPENSAIEVEENKLGEVSGGATLEYKPSYYTAKSDLGRAMKTILTDEEVTLKSGVMTINASTLAALSDTARESTSEDGKMRILKIGGAGNQKGERRVVHFHHKDEADGDIRVTIVGNNQAGFSLAFQKDKETVVDAEFKALSMDDEGTLIIYQEEILDGTADPGTGGTTDPAEPTNP